MSFLKAMSSILPAIAVAPTDKEVASALGSKTPSKDFFSGRSHRQSVKRRHKRNIQEESRRKNRR